MAAIKDLSIQQGKTFSLALRWEAPPIVYKGITAITQTAPVRLTVPGHGIADGWRAAVTGVKGMVEINAEANNVKARDHHQATVVDVDTIEFNDINATGFRPYLSGGILQFNTPVILAGFVARMSIKNKIGGLVLLSLTTENGGIAIDVARNVITLNITAEDTALIMWRSGVYDLELESPGATPVVTELLTGRVSVTKEVTT